MKHLIILATLCAFNSNLFAEVETNDLAIADESIDAPALNIEGQYQEKEVKLPEVPKKEVKKIAHQKIQKPLTPSEKIRLYREQLEVRNQMMVQRKMEQIRLQQEIALAHKLEQSMNQTIQAIDSSLK
jgi:hypothetical protein